LQNGAIYNLVYKQFIFIPQITLANNDEYSQ
jgi:hypothetical protein